MQTIDNINVNGKQFIIKDINAIHKPQLSTDGQIIAYNISLNDWIGINQYQINTKYQNSLNSVAASLTILEIGKFDYQNIVSYINDALILNEINFIQSKSFKQENVFIKFSSNYNSTIKLSGNYKLNGDDITSAKAGEIWQLNCLFILDTCLVTCTKWG